jgi:hypothetical protein
MLPTCLLMLRSALSVSRVSKILLGGSCAVMHDRMQESTYLNMASIDGLPSSISFSRSWNGASPNHASSCHKGMFNPTYGIVFSWFCHEVCVLGSWVLHPRLPPKTICAQVQELRKQLRQMKMQSKEQAFAIMHMRLLCSRVRPCVLRIVPPGPP